MIEKPLISFCLISYNQESYIEEAIKGALSQEYFPLEIIISDDCSSDNTYSIIKKMLSDYKGPHLIKINQNKINMGLVPHLNKTISDFVHGEYVILAAGDDISLPFRTRMSLDLFENDDIMCVSFNADFINSNSEPIGRYIYPKDDSVKYYNIKDFLSNKSFSIHGATKAFRKCVFEFFGPLNPQCPTEDSTLTFRGLLLGRIAVSSVSAIKYRTHNNNLSGISNIFKLNSGEIAKQYESDCDKYFNLRCSLENSKLKNELLDRISLYEFREAFIRDCAIKRSNRIIFILLFTLMKTKAFSITEKITIFKLLIKSIL